MATLNNVRLLQETSVVHPHRTTAYHGETINFSIDFRNYGAQVNLTGATAALYWRVPSDEEGYWHQGEATCAGSTASWTWDATMDNGESPVTWFLKVDADDSNDTISYRATGEIRLLASPGFTPAVIPPAHATLDFDLITVLHAPYYTKTEADGRFAASADIPDPSTAAPQMDGAASAGSSAAYARGDHRHPVDTSRVAKAGDTMTGNLDLYDDARLCVGPIDGVVGDKTYYGRHGVTDLPEGNGTGNTINFPNKGGTIALTSDIPSVVAPSTSSSDAGKAADAKATGDALAGKLGTGGGTISGDLTVLQSGPSSGGNVSASAVTAGALTVQGTATISTLNINGGGLQINGTTFPAETWTFTLDDDSTVQKQLLVAPVAAQGGA